MGPVMRNSIRYSQKDYAVSISLFVRNARRTSLVEKLFQREISKKKKKKDTFDISITHYYLYRIAHVL